MQTQNCLIIEDEVLASNILKEYISQYSYLNLVAVCEDIFSANEILNSHSIDILFLDINLPKVNGIDFLKQTSSSFYTIITSAYHEYAIESFELAVTDYLLKPISFERFQKAIRKTIELIALQSNKDGGIDNYLFIKHNGLLEKVSYEQITFIESKLNYVMIHTINKKILTYSSLKNIEASLPKAQFIKIQKSYIVAKDKVERIHNNEVLIRDIKIPISRQNREHILSQLISHRV